MDVKAKRKELLRMNDRAFVDRILAFPDREKLNRDENGKRRQFPSGEMAVRAKKQLEKDPDYKISSRQKFAMADSFATYSTDELKVSGITFAKADPNTLVKQQVSKEGVKTVYDMKFHLQPEPGNPYDKNAVAVLVDNVEGGRTRIGYVPAAYTAEHPITKAYDVKGTLTDHSNGHFKTISYAIGMDTESVYRDTFKDRNPEAYTYRMPFVLNGDVKDGAGEYLTNQRDWANKVTDELEYYGVNGHIDSVRFDFPGGRAGDIIVETSQKLNSDAVGICGSYFRFSLETGISSDLKRDGYVDVPVNLPAVNTRERTYFSLQAEPDDFANAIDSMEQGDGGQGL